MSVMENSGLDIAAELSRLEAEFGKLERQLLAWVEHQQAFSPMEQQAQDNKRRFAGRIVKAWRKEAAINVDEAGNPQGYRLELMACEYQGFPR